MYVDKVCAGTFTELEHVNMIDNSYKSKQMNE